jgi:glycosyltransferase involved in cell wall biosynthesis
LKIAIAGTRGVPPAYGGFETFAAELGTRLVQRGHEVTVYCRKLPNSPVAELPGPSAAATRQPGNLATSWNGIRRIVLPALSGKYFETVSHTLFSAIDAMRRDFDVVLVCNAANAFALPLLRAARIPVAINVDGIERRRRKWNILGRAFYALGEAFSVHFAKVIADADVIADYYRENYAIEPAVIRYGAEFPNEPDSDILQRLGIDPRNYILYVSRFEPENNPLEVVQAYEEVAGRGLQVAAPATRDLLPPLVMLGHGLYAPGLVQELKRHESANVLFPGALYGADYRTLQRHAFLYIHATEVGGTHPALIEAMASGGAVAALDTPENREVGGDAIRYYDLGPSQTLSGTLCESLGDFAETDEFRAQARRRARARFGWEAVTDAYERLFLELG